MHRQGHAETIALLPDAIDDQVALWSCKSVQLAAVECRRSAASPVRNPNTKRHSRRLRGSDRNMKSVLLGEAGLLHEPDALLAPRHFRRHEEVDIHAVIVVKVDA